MGLKISLTLGVMVFLSIVTRAEWVGPEVIIQSGWGDGDDEFGIYLDDGYAYQDLPGEFDVSRDGYIVMADRLNGRFKIFDNVGGLKALVIPPVDQPERYSLDPLFIGDVPALPLTEFFIYNLEGDLIHQNITPSFVQDYFNLKNEFYIYQRPRFPEKAGFKERWVKYSEQGDLLETYNQEPLVLGRQEEKLIIWKDKKHRLTTVRFDDIVMTTTDTDLCRQFRRDSLGNIYCVRTQLESPNQVVRFNHCGKRISTLILPEDLVAEEPTLPGYESYWTAESVYYDNKIDAYGNVYALWQTPDHHSLVKWTWQDTENDKNEGPDAPIYARSTDVQANGVVIEWDPAFQDPGCVTGYELLRSTEADTGFEVIERASIGQLLAVDSQVESGKTYFYRLRSKSIIGDSPLSDFIQVTIPES